MKTHFLFITLLYSVSSFAQTKSLSVDFNTVVGTGKKMTGVNTGPHSIVSGTTEQCLKAIGNELIRTHDYHGPCDYWGYTNFFNYNTQTFNYSFQSHLTNGYNWASTDSQILEIISLGFQPFFRVGISFPGGGPSPASPMPKDIDGVNFTTFAGIAKRTAMHYTAGWDNGFYYTIPYWEIWNEPNNNASWPADSINAYYRIYQQCADSLKSFNPFLKVGGPAAAKNAFYTGGIYYSIKPDYVSNFLSFCQTNSVPLDFYSFHMYDRKNPYNLRILTDTLTYYLNQYGFSNTELIVSETSVNTGGYDNTSKGCSYLTSELISVFNARLSKFIWYRGVDLSPLCNSDIGINPSLTLNGYAYKFYNELNDSTPVIIHSIGNEFNSVNVNDSLNNLMILSGKNNSNSIVKVLISNHESVYSDINLTLQNLPWTSADNISIRQETINSLGYQSSSTSISGGGTLNYSIPNLADASVFFITFEKLDAISVETIASSANCVIFPNPFVSQTTLEINKNLSNATITIDNYLGQTVAQIKNISGQTITFNRNNLASGVYFIRLTEENKTIVMDKLVIN